MCVGPDFDIVFIKMFFIYKVNNKLQKKLEKQQHKEQAIKVSPNQCMSRKSKRKT